MEGSHMVENQIRRILAGRKKVSLRDKRLQRAAVLIPLFEKEGQDHLLLTRRTDKVPLHKGQISFPGGRQDPADPDLLATALREAREEMGIEEKDVKILGELDDIATVTDFRVTPFVGWIPYPYAFRINLQEIEEAIEVPVAALLDPANVRQEWQQRHGKAYLALSYQYGPHHIWGATAMIIQQFLDLLPRSSFNE